MRVIGVLLSVGLLFLGTAGTASADAPIRHEVVPAPTVSGPVAGTPFTASPIPLRPAGYTEQEYLLTGTATGYQQVGAWGENGDWAVAPAEQAPYTTRIVVRRPRDPARFNGTVVVEWLNVTAGADIDFDYLYDSAELLREGYAWVGVSAQQTGVNALRAIDPARYGSLRHPGDTFSYSIFSQVARALADHGAGGTDPLGGLRPRALIASGDSQSALRLATYANAIQPVDRLYDGFLIHSRSAGSAALSQSPQSAQPAPAVSHVRSDVGVPVLTVETETDLFNAGFPYFAGTQADGPDFRLWEIAGVSHLTSSALNLAVAEVTPFLPTPPDFTCTLPANDGEQNAVLDDALAQLNRWVRTGLPAQHAPRIDVTSSPGTPTIVRDRFGNALGGIRTPAIQAPIATLSGDGNSGSNTLFCSLAGTTTPFSAQQLSALYPSHASYVSAVGRAALADTLTGFLLPSDARQIVAAAAASSVGGPARP